MVVNYIYADELQQILVAVIKLLLSLSKFNSSIKLLKPPVRYTSGSGLWLWYLVVADTYANC